MFTSNKLALLATVIVGLQFSGTTAQNISQQCQSALSTVVGSSDASCLNAQGLAGLVLSTSGSQSIVPSIDSWLKTLCGRPACSNATLAAVVQNITSGCQTDLSSLGLNNVGAAEITTLVQSAYPTVRQVLCLADANNGSTLCLTETLSNIEPFTGTLTPQNIESLATGFIGGNVPNIPANVSCTDCTKAAYNIIQQNYGNLIPNDTTSTISSTCGASFVDGSQPSTVTQLASNSQSSTTVTPNGAAPSFSAVPLTGLVAASLVALTSVFALLA